MSSQKWVGLVWKMIPHPVASFCTHSWPPSGLKSQNLFFFQFVWPPSPHPLYIGAGQPPIGADYSSFGRGLRSPDLSNKSASSLL